MAGRPQAQEQVRCLRSHFHSRPVVVRAIRKLPLASRKATGAPRCSRGSKQRPVGLSTCQASSIKSQMSSKSLRCWPLSVGLRTCQSTSMESVRLTCDFQLKPCLY